MESADETRLVCREMVVHVEEGVISERFYACRLYSRECINQLLEKLELTSIQYHNITATDSDRNQALGMLHLSGTPFAQLMSEIIADAFASASVPTN